VSNDEIASAPIVRLTSHMSSDVNRRTHDRFPFASRLEIRQRRGGRTPAGEDVQRVARATAIDVSVSGLAFRSALPLAVGDLISVSLPDAEGLGVRTSDGLGAESPAAKPPRRSDVSGGLAALGRAATALDPSFEILAIVRHVHRDGADYFIGAERRADA